MTGGRARGLLLVPVLLLLLPAKHSLSLGMSLMETNITGHDFFFAFDDVNATTQPREFAEYKNMSFSGKKKPKRFTLDYRCDHGLPLTVRWTNYGPYASLVLPTNRPPKSGVGVTGIFPRAINRVLAKCCHRDTRVQEGEFIATFKGLENSLAGKYKADMVFPVGLQSMSMTSFKDLPVVPLLHAPRTTLIVPEAREAGRTLQLFRTVGMAWPILAFIFLAAILSGVFIWALDHVKNPSQFPPPFTAGVWEGFWWAVVTMTTVGYGDRAPRSILGRLFCIIWIVIGMSIIAIFTAMITASLSASIQYRFVIHGSVMGAVAGSEEERVATGLNAEVKSFQTPTDVVNELVKTNLEVAIMDNYLLSYYHAEIKREPVRVVSNMEQSINYGLVFAPNSTKFTECFQQFVRNNPQDIFDIIRSNLNPLKNPTDEMSEELKASQGFLSEKAFKMILSCLAGVMGAFFLLGIIIECARDRLQYGKRPTEKRETNRAQKSIFQSFVGFRLSHGPESNADDARRLETIKQRSSRIRHLIREYDEFYDKWIEKLKDVVDEDEWGKIGEKTANGKNGSLLMVTYNGNRDSTKNPDIR